MFTRGSGRGPLWRSRWAAIGAAVTVAVGAGGVAVTMAAGPGPSSFVPITPCRVMDTRTGNAIGPRSTPLEGGVPYTIKVHGMNGKCDLPATVTGVNMNVTMVNPSAGGYLTVWPADVDQPEASSLNWTAGQAPTPNAVTVAVSSGGQISFFASAGTVDLIADITGYFVPAGAAGGPPGPPGPVGERGPVGQQCAATLRWDLARCQIATLPLPAGALTPAGIATNGRSLIVANAGSANVSRVDIETLDASNIALPAGAATPMEITFDGSNFWTANATTNNVTRINGRMQVKNFALPPGAFTPVDVLFDGTNVWTLNGGSNSLSRIDPASGVAANVPLPAGTNGCDAIAFDGRNIWVLSSSPAKVTLVDPTSGDAWLSTDLNGLVNPGDLAFDGRNMWVTDIGSPNVLRIGPGLASIQSFELTGVKWAMWIAFDGTSLWAVANAAMVKIDPSTGESVPVSLPLSTGVPNGVAFDGTNVWTANSSPVNLTRFVP